MNDDDFLNDPDKFEGLPADAEEPVEDLPTADFAEGTDDETDGEAADQADEETGDATDEEAADEADEETADQADEETGDATDEETADQADEETGDATDEETGDATDEEAGDATDESEGDDGTRRLFLTKVWAASIGAVVGFVPFVCGLLFFLDPLIRGKRSRLPKGESQSRVVRDDEGFLRLAVTRDALPVGTPQMVTVRDDLVDAWNLFPDVPIGSVWLRKSASGVVTAFNTICPHLGCSVEHRGAQGDFYCPCHLSAFTLEGVKTNPIPPRDMDTLAVKPGMGEEIWVQFKNFRGGIAEKVEI